MPVIASVEHDEAADERRAQRRRDKLAAQRVLWSETTLPAVRGCGRYPVKGNDAGVRVRVTRAPDGSHAGFGGIQNCGSVWACPVCSAIIAAERQREIEAVIREAQRRGYGIVSATFTMRHNKGHALKTLWDGLSDAWHAVTSGSVWLAEQDAFGVMVDRIVKTGKRKGQVVVESRIPWVRVVETTVGDHGWHVHVHFLLFVAPGSLCAGPLVEHDIAGELLRSMFGRWEAGLASHGLDAMRDSGGMDYRVVTDDADAAGTWAAYLTKNTYDAALSASFEVARGDLKTAASGHRKPFDVLRDLYTRGEVEDLELWHEWERGSKGRQQIGWSLAAAHLRPVEPEKSDQEIVDEDRGGETVLWLTLAGWRVAHRHKAEILEAAEVDDLTLRVVLSGLGVEWYDDLPVAPSG